MGWGNHLFRVCESQFQTQEDTHSSDTDLVLVSPISISLFQTHSEHFSNNEKHCVSEGNSL